MIDMAWRFRRSVQILPGVKINFNRKSTSLTIGGHGIHKTFSSTGRTTTSLGIPGTGLYYTTSTGRKNQQTSKQTYAVQPSYATVPATPSMPAVNIEAVRNSIESIYRIADKPINWKKMLVSDSPDDKYFHDRAERILEGDIDTYYEVINDVNPLDDLIQYGSDFECGTDDPRMLAIHFHVNSRSVLGEAQKLPKTQYNDLLQDYVCGCSIRIACDMFALLPIRHVIVDAWDLGGDILSVDFKRKKFDKLDFANLDASDTVKSFEYRMNFTLDDGFKKIEPLDNIG